MVLYSMQSWLTCSSTTAQVAVAGGEAEASDAPGKNRIKETIIKTDKNFT